MRKNEIKEIFKKLGFEVGVTQKGELIGKRVKAQDVSSKTQKSSFLKPIMSVGKNCKNPKASFVFGLGRIWK